MKGLGRVCRGGISLWLNEAKIKTCLTIHGDVPRSSIDKDMHYERTGGMRVKKYLRENCYHRIECSVTNSLATLMRK